MSDTVTLTILMPCLNEVESLPFCISEAQAFLAESGVAGEILIADNGSTDGSQETAAALGARVVSISRRGYGAALRGGIEAAQGRYVIMADADGSYDLYRLSPILHLLESGASLTVGDRYALGFEKGASPFLHRAVGVPALSAFGRLAQRVLGTPKAARVHDFHCGLRGVRRDDFLALHAAADGMEFASEMILLATAEGQRIEQFPTGLRRDHRRSGTGHIRAVRDGLRHVRTILRFLPGGDIYRRTATKRKAGDGKDAQ